MCVTSKRIFSSQKSDYELMFELLIKLKMYLNFFFISKTNSLTGRKKQRMTKITVRHISGLSHAVVVNCRR